MNDQTGRGITLLTTLLMLLLLCPFTIATAGTNSGEVVLDTSNNYKSTNSLDASQLGRYMFPGAGLLGVAASSVLTNTFSSQFQNKEAAGTGNPELDVAKQNYEQSKDNVSQMYGFLAGTLFVFFDGVLSIFYILLVVITIWVIFVGYAKIMILLIDFVYGRLKKKRARQ